VLVEAHWLWISAGWLCVHCLMYFVLCVYEGIELLCSSCQPWRLNSTRCATLSMPCHIVVVDVTWCDQCWYVKQPEEAEAVAAMRTSV
jgi:hypothetical protein